MKSKAPKFKSTLPVPQREKYWSELDDKERIARLRHVVRDQGNTIEQIKKTVSALLEQFGQHQHAKNGDVLVHTQLPITDRIWFERRLGDRGLGPDDVYL